MILTQDLAVTNLHDIQRSVIWHIIVDGMNIRPFFAPGAQKRIYTHAEIIGECDIVYGDKTPITDPQELYSGCYGRAIINFYVYDTQGNKGISAGLNGVMKLYDGEPLGGGVVTDSDWDDGWEDDDADDDLLG